MQGGVAPTCGGLPPAQAGGCQVFDSERRFSGHHPLGEDRHLEIIRDITLVNKVGSTLLKHWLSLSTFGLS